MVFDEHDHPVSFNFLLVWALHVSAVIDNTFQVDCIVTTTGGIEEDLMKCMAPSYLGDFSLRGAELRKKGINRIGNLIVPNTNYCMFEQWILPIWDKMLEEQNTLVTFFFFFGFSVLQCFSVF